MKKYHIALLLFVFLLLVGCGSSDVETTEVVVDEEIVVEEISDETVDDEEEEVVEEEEEIVVDYSLSSEEEELLESRFDPQERAELSTPLVKGLNSGDVHVIGLGVRNILGQSTHDFVIEVDLVEMRDYSNSKHDTDDALIEEWFARTDVGPYTLERSDEVVVPLIIEVGDAITAQDSLLPGNYIFDINVVYLTDSGATDPYESVQLTVQIAE